MEKPKHKDGMLAAGKKRLEQFRQKRGKGNSSKPSRAEFDGDHKHPVIDLEQGPANDSKAAEKTGENDQSESSSTLRKQQSVEEYQIDIEQISAAYPIHVAGVDSKTCISDSCTGMKLESVSANDEIVDASIHHTSSRSSGTIVFSVKDPGIDTTPTSYDTAPAPDHRFTQESIYKNSTEHSSDSSISIPSESSQAPKRSGCPVSYDVIMGNVGLASILDANSSQESDRKMTNAKAETYLTCTDEAMSISKLEMTGLEARVEPDPDIVSRNYDVVCRPEQPSDEMVSATERGSLDDLIHTSHNQPMQEKAEQTIVKHENLVHVFNEGETSGSDQARGIVHSCTVEDSDMMVEKDGSVTESSQESEGASELCEEGKRICSAISSNYHLADNGTKDALQVCIEDDLSVKFNNSSTATISSQESVVTSVLYTDASKLGSGISSDHCPADGQGTQLLQECIKEDSNVTVDNKAEFYQDFKDASELNKEKRQIDFAISPKNIINDISTHIGEASDVKIDCENNANTCPPDHRNLISTKTNSEGDTVRVNVVTDINEAVNTSSLNLGDANVDVEPFMNDENICHAQEKGNILEHVIDPRKGMVCNATDLPCAIVIGMLQTDLPKDSLSSGSLMKTLEQSSLDTLQAGTMTEVAADHMENGPENVSEDSEKMRPVNIETSETLIFEKHTDRMLEYDKMEHRFTDIKLLEQKTICEKPFDIAGLDSDGNAREVEMALDTYKDEGNICPLQGGYDIVDTTFDSSLEHTSGSVGQLVIANLETINQVIGHQVESKMETDKHEFVTREVTEEPIYVRTIEMMESVHDLVPSSASSFELLTETGNNLSPPAYLPKESEVNVAVGDIKDAMEDGNDVKYRFLEISKIATHDLRTQTGSTPSKVVCSDIDENVSVNTSLGNQDGGLSHDFSLKENLIGLVQKSTDFDGSTADIPDHNVDLSNLSAMHNIEFSQHDSLEDRFEDNMTCDGSHGMSTENDNKVVAEETYLTGELQTASHITETVGMLLQDKLNPLAFNVSDESHISTKNLMHIAERLRSLVHEDLKTEAGFSYVKLEDLKQDCDGFIDKLQKNIEERKQIENTMKKLENELSNRENHLVEITKEFTELSQNYVNLQNGLEEKLTLEKKVKLEFIELSEKCKELERNVEEKMMMEKEVRQEFSELSQRYEEDKEEKLKMDLKVKDLENSLSVRDIEIEKLNKEVSELLHNYNLLTQETAKTTEEKMLLEAGLEDLKCLYAEMEQMYMGTCSRASALSEQISVAVKVAHDSEYAGAGSFDLLESSVVFLMKQYEANCIELKLLSERCIDNDSLHKAEVDDLKALNVSNNEELHHMRTQIEFLTSELTKAKEEIVQQTENNEELQKKLAEMSKSYEVLYENLQENMHLESKLRRLEDSLSIKEADIERLSQQVSDIITEAAKTTEEKESLEHNFERMQRLHAEHEELHSRMSVQANTLLDKVYVILEGSNQLEHIDGDFMASLENAVNSLIAQYKDNVVQLKQLIQRVDNTDDALIKETDSLKEVAAKDAELSSLYDMINLLKSELSKTKEESDQKVQQAEEKLLGIREKLSMAVTKGKGLLQQRDNLKQLLAEKTSELDAVTSSYNHELQLKVAALREADSKVKLYADSVDRVEALESELSYIRNSANALRESFLQKDALLQKIEELLEYSNIPAEVQLNDIFEKVEWLIEAYNQKNLVHEGETQSVAQAVREFNERNTDSASHMQEIEELERKCEDLLRKYREMAEQSAMLEQSLLERNLIIQKWEEVLDVIDMPAIIKAKEPEDRIQWLGREVYDSHARCTQLEQEVKALQLKAESIEDALHKLRDENNIINAELEKRKEQFEMKIMDSENISNSSLKNPYQDEDQLTDSATSNSTEIEGKTEMQSKSLLHHSPLEDLVASFPTMIGDLMEEGELERILSAPSLSVTIEQLLMFLIQKINDLTQEIADAKDKMENVYAERGIKKERELESDQPHEIGSSKSVGESDFRLQSGELHIVNSALEEEVKELKNQVEIMREQLALMRNEVAKSNLEASQAEEKLASVREKLSMAIKKGKGVVQQRDVLKQSMEEKISELNEVIKEKEAEGLALKQAEQNIRNLVQRVNALEVELATSRDYALDMDKSLQETSKTLRKFVEVVENITVIGAPHSGDIIEKIQWLSQSIIDSQKRVGISEQEAKKSKKAVELLALELEEIQGRFDSVNDELKVAEKNISILNEEKKVVEAAKAEAVFRLEHAMANINSLLFELSGSKESLAKLERDYFALTAEMEDMKHKLGKSQEYLNDLPHLHSKVCSLKDSQAALLNMMVVDCLKLAEDIKRSSSLAIKLSKGFSSFGTDSPFSAFHDSVKPSSLMAWKSEYLNSQNDGWKQSSVTGSLKLLCELMETELESFGNLFRNFIEGSSQDTAAISQLLIGACDELYSISQKMENLKIDINLTNSIESLKLQKDEKISSLEISLMTVVEQIKSSIKGLEKLNKPTQSVNNARFDFSDLDVLLIAPLEVEKFTLALLGRFNSAVEDLAVHWEERNRDRQENEELRNGLAEAKLSLKQMEEQRRQDELSITELQKSLNILQVNDDILRKDYEELQNMMLIKRQDEEQLVGALKNAETKVVELCAKVEELQKSKQDLEASLSKASNRFSTTVSNFNNFKKLAEKLVEEAQGQHLLLEGRDAQISQLREENASKRSEIASLKNLVDERTTVLSQICEQLSLILGKDDATNELITSIGSRTDANSLKEILRKLTARIQLGPEDLHIQLARKDALLQDMQMRHDVLAGKVKFLQASLQENQRLQEERNNSIMPEQTADSSQPQIDEMGNKAKLIVPPPAIVTRGRKVSATDHVVLDLEMRNDKSFGDATDDDKGHAFKPLTSSRLIPRGVRFLVDRIDGFWVSGERLLMRSPEARLSIMLYSILVHIWMAVLLF